MHVTSLDVYELETCPNSYFPVCVLKIMTEPRGLVLKYKVAVRIY